MAIDLNSYDAIITDGSASVGLMLRSPSAIRRMPRGTGVVRDKFAQADWSGGRGLDRAATDTSRFGDSANLWTMNTGKAMLAPLAVAGYLNPNSVEWMPGTAYKSGVYSTREYAQDVQWVALSGSQANLGKTFTAGSSGSFTYYVSCIAKPGAGTILATLYYWETLASNWVTLDSGAAQVTDTYANEAGESYRIYGASLVATIVSGSSYLLAFSDAGGDEIGCYAGVGKQKADGGAWGDSAYIPYFRMVIQPADATQNYWFFEYKQALYAWRSGSSAGTLYLNGDRGVATGTSSGSALVDTSKAWATDEWAGCAVMISNGPGIGQTRLIRRNTATQLSLQSTVGGNLRGVTWTTTPISGSSEYVILGSHKWVARAGAPAGNPVSTPAVCNDFVYVPFGSAGSIGRYQEANSAGVWTAGSAADADKAHYLLTTLDPTGKLCLMKALNQDLSSSGSGRNTWARATAVNAWGTNLTWSTPKPIGDNAGWIQAMCLYDSTVYVGKTDGIWQLKSDDTCLKVNLEMHPVRKFGNTLGMKGWQTNLYFPVIQGFERLYGQVTDDIGPNRDEGLDDARQGEIRDFCPVLAHGYAALDAGDSQDNGNRTDYVRDNMSTVLCTLSPGGGWHALYNGWYGKPIRNLFYQRYEFGGRLIFGCGNDIYSLAMPADVFNPDKDSAFAYTWAGYLTTAWIDLGDRTLPHFFDLLNLLVDGTGGSLAVEYQTESVTNWTSCGSAAAGAYTTLPVRVAAQRIKFRLIFTTAEAAKTPILKNFDLRGHTINETLCDVVIDFNAVDKAALLGGKEANTTAADLITQLDAWSQSANLLTLSSRNPVYLNVRGHIDPVSFVPQVPTGGDPAQVADLGSLTFKSISTAV